MEELTWEEVQRAVKVALIGTADKWDHTGHDEGVLAALEAIRQAMKEKSISKMMEEAKNDTTKWPTF